MNSIFRVVEKGRLYLENQQKLLTGILALVLCLVVGFRAYMWHQNNQQVQAHAALIEVLHDFKVASYFGKKWDDVELSALTGYRRFRSTKVGPYFLALQAQALAMQDKHSEALVALKDALKQLKASAPLYASYQLLSAVMAIDTGNADEIAAGREALHRYATDAQFPLRDEALYRLGIDQLLSGNYQEAMTTFKTLVTEYPAGKNGSAWAGYAREQFGGILGEKTSESSAAPDTREA